METSMKENIKIIKDMAMDIIIIQMETSMIILIYSKLNNLTLFALLINYYNFSFLDIKVTTIYL